MSKKPSLTNLTTMYNAAGTISENNDKIEASFENTISRDGSTPNNMLADLDLDNNDLLNVKEVFATEVTVDGVSLTDQITATADSAAAAAVSEVNASTSATNAANSASAASTSASNAATSETNAATSETNAAASAASIVGDVADAEAARVGAELAETNAQASELAASLSEAAAALSETNAATSASNAATSETNAAASASASADSAVASSNSADAAALTASSIAGYDLGPIAETLTATAVDVSVYDTSQDSDSGAWRKRMQSRSWYQETLNTATRGSRREFPSVALIIATALTVTIYDADDPTLPMWRVEDYTGLTITSVTALDGKLIIGTTTGVVISDYAADSLGSTTPDYTTATTPALVNNSLNDVAITVEAGSPIDAATGLAVPTIYAGTNGGLSVINNTGTVTDSATTSPVDSISVVDDGFWYSVGGRELHYSTFVDAAASDGFGDKIGDTDGTGDFINLTRPIVNAANGNSLALGGPTDTELAIAGLMLQEPNYTTQAEGMSALITDEFNTGWMVGDIKGAFLSSTDTASLVGGTDDDRSVNDNPLTVNGTITRIPVATGSDLVSYGNFGPADRLSQPYNADLDFGTGDFSFGVWSLLTSSVSTKYIIWRGNYSGGILGSAIALNYDSTDRVQFRITDDAFSTVDEILWDGATLDKWQQLWVVRRGATLYLYANGVEVASTSVVNAAGSLSNANAKLGIGNLEGLNTAKMNGRLALVRASATAPTAAQIKKSYEDEKFLFQENSKAVLTNSTVEALAFDADTKLLHVGGDVGRDEFQGLRRTATTAGAVTSAISAQNKLVMTGKAATIDVSQPAISLRELLNVLR